MGFLSSQRDQNNRVHNCTYRVHNSLAISANRTRVNTNGSSSFTRDLFHPKYTGTACVFWATLCIKCIANFSIFLWIILVFPSHFTLVENTDTFTCSVLNTVHAVLQIQHETSNRHIPLLLPAAILNLILMATLTVSHISKTSRSLVHGLV
jgi:hypothetical protein